VLKWARQNGCPWDSETHTPLLPTSTAVWPVVVTVKDARPSSRGCTTSCPCAVSTLRTVPESMPSIVSRSLTRVGRFGPDGATSTRSPSAKSNGCAANAVSMGVFVPGTVPPGLNRPCARTVPAVSDSVRGTGVETDFGRGEHRPRRGMDGRQRRLCRRDVARLRPAQDKIQDSGSGPAAAIE